MADTIIVDGIIDAIKELREVANCPFCDERLEFESADKSLWRSADDSFTLSCPKCKLDFSLRRKKDKWLLAQVRRSWHRLGF